MKSAIHCRRCNTCWTADYPMGWPRYLRMDGCHKCSAQAPKPEPALTPWPEDMPLFENHPTPLRNPSA